VWRIDADGGHEEPLTIQGVKSGSTVVPVNMTVWRDVRPPPPPTDVPAAPEVSTFAATTITGTSFMLYWDGAGAPVASPVRGYYVYINGVEAHDVGPEGSIVVNTVQDNVGHRMGVNITGLEAGGIYTVTIVAYNDIGSSTASAPFTVKTLEGTTALAPNAPTNFRATSVGTNVINVTWTASTLPVGATAVTGYRIYNQGTILLGSPGASATTFSLTGLTPDTAYALTIKAVNTAGESQASSIVNTRTAAEAIPLSAPTGLQVVGVGDGFVSLAWNPNADAEGVTGYQVYRGSTLVTSITGTSYAVQGLTNGTTYTFTVRAYRGASVSAASAPVTATPQAASSGTVPTAPTGLVVQSTGDAQVALDWNDNPVSENITNYRVISNGTLLDTTGGVSNYTATGLTNNTEYTFQTRAVNAAGIGPLSSSVTATPRAASSGATGLPFTADSFFKSRVDGPGVPIDATRTQQFQNFMATYVDPDGQSQAATPHPVLNIDEQWAMTYHIGKASDPIWKITPTAGKSFDSRLNIARTQGFHMADAKADTFPSGDQDRPGCMIDHVFGYTVQFANSVPNKATRVITCDGAGILWHSSNGLDYRNPRSNDQRNFTSRGRIINSMIITREDLDRAVAAGTGVGHTLHLFHCETRTSDGFCHPMTAAESDCVGWGTEGERLRIKPSVNLVGRGISGHALAVARTMQEHGAYLGDNSGSVTVVKMAQPQFYTGTNIARHVFQGKLSWRTDFEVVQRGWQ
jgi:fibronectin type 3 domain-containing protein